MNQARILGLGLSVGVAIALAGCSVGTVRNGGECIYIPTGERFVVEKGSQASIGNGHFLLNARGRDGYVRAITSENAEHWKCREAGR